MRLGYSLIFYNENSHIGAGGSREIELAIHENYSGTLEARIYLDGGAVPAFEPMVITEGVFNYGRLVKDGLVEGTYVVEYKDDNGERVVGKVNLWDLENSCYDDAGSEQGIIGYIQIISTGLRVWTNVRPVSNAGRSISIDGGTTWKTTVSANAHLVWSNSELTALGVDDSIPSITIERTSNACTIVQVTEVMSADLLDALAAEYVKTNITASDADDGTITLTVSGGSGSYTYLWNDAETTQNRSALAPGIYSVVVTDTVTLEEVEIEDITIEEPQAEIVSGDTLEFSPLNSITFVVDPVVPDGIEVLQTPDNTLFADQVFPRIGGQKYFNKICNVDERLIQFNSDFPYHTVGLFNCDDELIKSFTALLKEENISLTEDYLVTIKNHTDNPGKSRVYFNVGEVPIDSLDVGSAFQILNNAEGFDGSYEVVAIEEDVLLGYNYLVINKNYDAAGASTSATGRFNAAPVNFNVYESLLIFSDVDEGIYYVKVVASDDLDNEKIGVSEPISIKVSHPDTNLLVYRSNDNSFNTTWTTGYIGRIRVESSLLKRGTGGERSISRQSDFSLVKINAKKTRVFTFETFMLPPYLHEKLGLIFDCDFCSINGIEVQSSEEYQEASYPEYFMLGNSSIKLEQVGWLDRYNSHDIGSIADGGFLITDQGLLKL